ncbi:MAG: SH3 domain-containing protein [Defluviitaleaceae bacterium]|nr:SH3 domain-containing protein [Defluviitaleaceae bacterium]
MMNIPMRVKVIQDHPGEGQFPIFSKGTNVTITGGECDEFAHWFPCEIDGHQTYIPEIFLSDGNLTRDYNPTELVQDVGDILEVREIVNAWLFAANDKGQTGWIPAEAVISV